MDNTQPAAKPSLRFYIPITPIDFDSYEDPLADKYPTTVINFKKLLRDAKKFIEKTSGKRVSTPKRKAKKVVDDDEESEGEMMEDEEPSKLPTETNATTTSDNNNEASSSSTIGFGFLASNNDEEEEYVFESESAPTQPQPSEQEKDKQRREKLKTNTILTTGLLTQSDRGEIDPDELDWELLSETNSHANRLNDVIHNITKRERQLKYSLTLPERGSSKSTKKKKEEEKRRFDYDSEDSFIDDTEYDVIATDFPMIPHQEAQQLEKHTFYDDEDSEEDSDESSSDEDDTLGGDDQKNSKFHEEIEEAITELEELSKSLGFDSSKSYKTIPPELNEGIKKLALARLKHFKKGVPNTLLKRLRKIPPLNFGPKTIKDRMKSLVNEHEQVAYPAEISTLKTALKEALFREVANKLNETTLTYSATVYETLRDKFRKEANMRLSLSQETNELIKQIINKTFEYVDSHNKGKPVEEHLDKRKELDQFIKELRSIWPSKTDVIKKLKALVPEIESIRPSSSSASLATSSKEGSSSKPSEASSSSAPSSSTTTGEEKKKKKSSSSSADGEKKRKRTVKRNKSEKSDKKDEDSEPEEKSEPPRVAKKKKE
ncbi:predicted protein [Naegleria gruberi]|uniref:Predicted protein n=1 Tax=Naegleria gruberi TaxID=5762 RepID=D2VB82_NAEGR|nr:uncharacterized protein NAEGRDRAFT_48133 [Naegleria gruberi]EFC45863.1 predicted protein [Naegleria gruberi]|eukprot:XP_002678607.1 predicted protein [Naegleria gruberi strain NEG-M]